jgi:hypothetical protein
VAWISANIRIHPGFPGHFEAQGLGLPRTDEFACKQNLIGLGNKTAFSSVRILGLCIRLEPDLFESTGV